MGLCSGHAALRYTIISCGSYRLVDLGRQVAKAQGELGSPLDFRKTFRRSYRMIVKALPSVA